MCHFGISLVQNVIVSPDEPQRRPRREDELLLRLVLLQDVVLERAAEPCPRRRPIASALATNIANTIAARAVDRHRRRDRAEVDVAVEVLDVGERVDGDAALADLAERERVVGVAAHQGRQVERRRESVTARGEQIVEAAVRVDRGAEARRTSASSRASTGTSTRTVPAVYGYWPGNSPSAGPYTGSTGTPDIVAKSAARCGAASKSACQRSRLVVTPP